MSTLKKEDLAIVEENKENFKESVISRKNLVNKFTIADIEKHLADLHKMKKEADGTISVAVATKENIEKNHKDFLKDLSDKQKHHVWMWQEQQNIISEVEPQQKGVDEEVAKHEEYLAVIYDAFGFVKTEVDEKA